MKSNESYVEVIEILKGISQYINDTRAMLCGPYGLSAIQSILILDIYHHKKQTKITDICRRLNKTTNTISPLINRLIEKGYLVKKQNTKDNRVYEIFLTSKSEKMLEKINESVLEYALPIFEKLSEEEFDRLFSSLKMVQKVCEFS